jgi:hypothetical protein
MDEKVCNPLLLNGQKLVTILLSMKSCITLFSMDEKLCNPLLQGQKLVSIVMSG